MLEILSPSCHEDLAQYSRALWRRMCINYKRINFLDRITDVISSHSASPLGVLLQPQTPFFPPNGLSGL